MHVTTKMALPIRAAARPASLPSVTSGCLRSCLVLAPSRCRYTAISSQQQDKLAQQSIQTISRPQRYPFYTTTTICSHRRNLNTMASERGDAHNNQDFHLSEVFNVKGKVALITGKAPRSIIPPARE